MSPVRYTKLYDGECAAMEIKPFFKGFDMKRAS